MWFSLKSQKCLKAAAENQRPSPPTGIVLAAPPTPPPRPCHHWGRSILLSCGAAPLWTDFSQSDAPAALSGHGRQSDPPRLPGPGLQLQQGRPGPGAGAGAGHHADELQGQVEQKDGLPLVCRRFCGGPGECLEISVYMLSKRRW